MSYYDNPPWPNPSSNTWEHQAAPTPSRAGVSGPQSQDDYAFTYQFDEVDRAYENLQKSGKGYAMGARRKPTLKASLRSSTPMFPDGRASQGNASRSHPTIGANFDAPNNLHNFYATQRQQPSRGTNEAEQVMQVKRRMAAQRERELRNLHTEQQYQRNALADLPQHNNKHLSEEETRELIARQRSALYRQGPFADKATYVDESGNICNGLPGTSGPSSLRGPSPLAYESIGRSPKGESVTPGSLSDHNVVTGDPNTRAQSTSSPQSSGPAQRVFDNAVKSQSRASTSSPTGGSSPRDLVPSSKSTQHGAPVAPIGTRPSGIALTSAPGKRPTTPLTSSGGWGRGNAVWGQSSGLGAPASVWG